MFESLCGAPCARRITRCRLSTAHQDSFQVLEREGPVAFLVIDHVIDVLVRPFLQRPRGEGRSPWVLSVSVAERVACARVCTARTHSREHACSERVPHLHAAPCPARFSRFDYARLFAVAAPVERLQAGVHSAPVHTKSTHARTHTRIALCSVRGRAPAPGM